MRTEKALIQQQMSKIDELRNENNILRDYIKKYKDKEEKLKAIAKDCLFPDGDYAEVMDVGNKLLQILNEEVK